MSQVQDQLGLFGEVLTSLVYSIRLSQKLKQKNQQSKEKGRETWRDTSYKEWKSNKPNHRPAVRSEAKNSVGRCLRSSLGWNATGTAFSAFGVL